LILAEFIEGLLGFGEAGRARAREFMQTADQEQRQERSPRAQIRPSLFSPVFGP